MFTETDEQPSFLDEPSILFTRFSPADFDFTKSSDSFIYRTNAFLRFYFVCVAIILLFIPTKFMLFTIFLACIFLVLYLQSEIIRRQKKTVTRKEEEESVNPYHEGFALLPDKTSSKPDPRTGSTNLYRKPTKQNPTGNYLPTDYLEQPEALPAPPANNKEADAERMKLMEEAIIEMSPHGAKLMESINASPTERKHFEQSLRPFLTNPVTAADTDMEAFITFLSGPNYKTRKIGKEEFVKQSPVFLQ